MFAWAAGSSWVLSDDSFHLHKHALCVQSIPQNCQVLDYFTLKRQERKKKKKPHLAILSKIFFPLPGGRLLWGLTLLEAWFQGGCSMFGSLAGKMPLNVLKSFQQAVPKGNGKTASCLFKHCQVGSCNHLRSHLYDYEVPCGLHRELGRNKDMFAASH